MIIIFWNNIASERIQIELINIYSNTESDHTANLYCHSTTAGFLEDHPQKA